MHNASHQRFTKNQLTGTRQVAKLKYLRVAPRKVRLIADLLRGLPVVEAEAQLILSPHRPSRPLLKLLRSAVANAKNNKKLASNRLVVEEIRVDQGPMLKRSMPRARGSASMIQKKMSHVTLILGETKTAFTERFTITSEIKKPKASAKGGSASGGKKGPASEREKKEEAMRPARAKSGFFKRIFQRKSV